MEKRNLSHAQRNETVSTQSFLVFAGESNHSGGFLGGVKWSSSVHSSITHVGMNRNGDPHEATTQVGWFSGSFPSLNIKYLESIQGIPTWGLHFGSQVVLEYLPRLPGSSVRSVRPPRMGRPTSPPPLSSNSPASQTLTLSASPQEATRDPSSDTAQPRTGPWRTMRTMRTQAAHLIRSLAGPFAQVP